MHAWVQSLGSVVVRSVLRFLGGLVGLSCVSEARVACHGLGTVPAVRDGVGDVHEEVLGQLCA